MLVPFVLHVLSAKMSGVFEEKAVRIAKESFLSFLVDQSTLQVANKNDIKYLN